MLSGSFAQTSFLGGEWAKTMQGRFDRPDYRTAMNLCLNGFPTDTGAWTRRSGTQNAGPTRGGVQARMVNFTVGPQPYTMEFTPGHLRFWNGINLVTTNDDQICTAMSTANPAKFTTTTAHGWATGDQVFFSAYGTSVPLLQNRVFSAAVTSSTQFTITDAITAATIDGNTLGAMPAGLTVSRALDLITPFSPANIAVLRSIAADLRSFLLTGTQPQVLTAVASTSSLKFATFTLAPASFQDGPYLDPFTNGVLATPSGINGNINLTLTFAAYDATRSYQPGDYVTSASVNYKSLVDQNLAHTPASSPTQWVAVSAASAIGANGFVTSDVGRHVRLFNGGWTWGRIIGLLNTISGTLAGSTNIGTMTSGGGLAAAFDGVVSKTSILSAASPAHSGNLGGGTTFTVTDYAGKNYTGASDQKISSATVTPSTDLGFCTVTGVSTVSGLVLDLVAFGFVTLTFNLRGKASAPASSSDGTLIGQTVTSNFTNTVIISSTDTTTAWKYVWVEVSLSMSSSFQISTWGANLYCAQVAYQSPAGTGASGNGCTIQIIGNALPNTNAISLWRIGLIASQTGWPTCGTYHEGRLWLAGVLNNRFDASASNNLLNFAPTNAVGTVADSNAISYLFNAPDTNTIVWMVPDLQGIISGTIAGEWLIQASALNNPLTPTSIQAHRVTTIGCASIEPRRTDHTLAFVQKHQHRVMEYFSDVFSGKFSAPNLSLTAKHLTTRIIQEIVYQQDLVPVIWARCADGSLIGCTYKRDSLMSSQGPTFAGWHQHTLGSGRVVESIAVGPSPSSATEAAGQLDTLVMATNDPSTNIRHVELMKPAFEEGDATTNAWFLDDAIVPTMTANVILGGVSSFQLSGLTQHNGKTVTVFAGGLDCGEHVVAAGSCSVPFGSDAAGLFTLAFANGYVGTLPVMAGFNFISDGQIVRPATQQESGARTGPALAKMRRTQQIGFLLNSTQAFYYGTDFTNMNVANFQSEGGTPYAANALFSGVFWDMVYDESSFDSMIAWRVKRPYPATVCALEAFLHTEDR